MRDHRSQLRFGQARHERLPDKQLAPHRPYLRHDRGRMREPDPVWSAESGPLGDIVDERVQVRLALCGDPHAGACECRNGDPDDDHDHTHGHAEGNSMTLGGSARNAVAH